MPQFLIKGMKVKEVQNISTQLVNELEEIIGCPRDYFRIECVDSTVIKDGNIVSGCPMVQVNWFDRGQEIQDKVAVCITDNIKRAGYEQVEIFFILLERNKYYEDGLHL
ncbi:DUF1904 family protein [Pelosinus propionicus]|uniref:DUF1904 domain-containing protein n=1 Tax=Pelosinus propionicus DSM 13327 TaxID=1123291 RepID=A0A1I4KMV8_9FIRM|nr:DUF1904 family protein [Pelosinus propionicus]SFL79909.1 protein of unknown function [Pelosinus propionicus DSM 13327]